MCVSKLINLEVYKGKPINEAAKTKIFYVSCLELMIEGAIKALLRSH